MRLVAYLRVSSDSQVDGYGLDAQEGAVRRWARTNDHRISETIRDVGVSGASDPADRAGLARVLSDVSTGRTDAVIVARLDRLARALTIQEATLAVIWRAGGRLITADHGEILQDDPE